MFNKHLINFNGIVDLDKNYYENMKKISNEINDLNKNILLYNNNFININETLQNIIELVTPDEQFSGKVINTKHNIIIEQWKKTPKQTYIIGGYILDNSIKTSGATAIQETFNDEIKNVIISFENAKLGDYIKIEINDEIIVNNFGIIGNSLIKFNINLNGKICVIIGSPKNNSELKASVSFEILR